MGAEHAISNGGQQCARRSVRRGWMCAGFLILLSGCFAGPLGSLFSLAMGNELHSHVILIPFASAYLLWLRAGQLPGSSDFSPWLGVLGAMAGGVALTIGLLAAPAGDILFWKILSFLFIAVGGVVFLMGRHWAWGAAFPLAFLIFMAPLPATAEHAIEHASKLASAEMANVLFTVSGTTFLRDGTLFHLPGIVLEVAQECSGIRSSYVLFITAVFAANLLLSTTWRRMFLVAFVIPLGVLRNGFRIFVIGSLCIHQGPHMVDSALHHRGGPIFFALSLIPLVAFLWWLRRRELRSIPEKLPNPVV